MERPVGAVIVTSARLDHHHGLLPQSAGGTAEGHLSGGGLKRRTAAGVSTVPAVLQLVGASAVAALVNEPDGAWRCVAGLAMSQLSPQGTQHAQTQTQRGK